MNLSNKAYDILKPIVQLWLPAIASLYFSMSQYIALPYPETVVGVMTCIITFLGAVLGISSVNYYESDRPYDGRLSLEPGAEGPVLKMDIIKSLDTKMPGDSITLKFDEESE